MTVATTSPSTVLITGCSSGFGLETARLFLARGWHVVATLRRPREGLLPASERLRLLPLDVTDPDSIRACVAEAGPIDALVNNAGLGLLAPLEGDRKSTRLNSSHIPLSRMPSSA